MFCQQNSLNHHCDPKSDSFLSSLVFQSATSDKSNYCGFHLVNVPPLEFNSSNYRLFINFPVSIGPKYQINSNYSIQGVLPAGLTFDSMTGEIKGTSTTVTSPTPITVIRNSPGYAVKTISLQVVDTSPIFVYGQYGSYSCSSAYNTGSCASSSPNNQNLSSPYGVAADTTGGVYISGINRLQYYPPNSMISTRVYGQSGFYNCDLANVDSGGTCFGTTVSANSLNNVRGIGISQSGELYAVDMGNNRVLHFPNQSNVPSVVYGQSGFSTSAAGAASATSLSTPLAVGIDSAGGVYVSESAYHRILYFPPGSTTASRVYGQTGFSGNTSGLSNEKMSSPNGMILDKDGGLYVSDNGNSRVLYFPQNSTTATRVYGQPDFNTSGGGGGPLGLSGPTGIALDQNENLFVADTGNNRVVMYPKTTQNAGIAAVAVLGQFDDLNCTLNNNNGSCSGSALGPKSLYSPTGIFFNQFGQLYIADRTNNRVLVY
ncbi:hypothetical protein EHQ30_04305 [Leptospira brenneri]|uniref:6-bladed beta-propeller n=2 Tax=Leptospira brenneri TaxID=2023182 RepID=A0A2M9Y778_9LEPT|nr:hypothetical protein CH361_02225 [Leptospira brenneri]TGK97161.1 hypothetical protein EHQ30_04305 [Leptospira brenneri]